MARDDSEELTYARNEVRHFSIARPVSSTYVYGQLKATLTALEADLEDLEESVKYAHSLLPPNRMFTQSC